MIHRTGARIASCALAWLMTATAAQPAGPGVGVPSNAAAGDWRYYAADAGSTKYSALAQIDRSNVGGLKIAWRYEGTEERPFWSNVRGSQERLPNGNTLITESEGGRLLEVTSDGEIVWEYVNPIRADDDKVVSIVCWGQRIDPKSLEPEFRALIEQGGVKIS